jgi:hypothetical protein
MAGFPSVAKGNKIGEKAKRPLPGIPFDKNLLLELIAKHRGNLSRVAEALFEIDAIKMKSWAMH